jgi:DNA invertase Pin-like site-specific DNA recombinase
LPKTVPDVRCRERQALGPVRIRERTGDGRKRAQAKGIKFGRKPKLSDYQRAEAIKRRAAGETLAEIATPSTFR